MVEFYFDIETTGKDPAKDRIITIQWQKLDRSTWAPVGDLKILKEWGNSEKGILEEFLPLAHCDYPWDFVFVGMNLMFDFHFLNERAKVYGLRGLDLSYCYDHPFLDLKHVLVFINNGRFTGYSQVLKGRKCLDRIDVPKLYRERRFQEILDYIKNEAELFGKALVILRREMPSLQEYFRGLKKSIVD